jgi:hypothetical protein
MAKFGVHTLHSRVLVFDTVLDVLVEATVGRLNHEMVIHGGGLCLDYIKELSFFFIRHSLLIK